MSDLEKALPRRFQVDYSTFPQHVRFAHMMYTSIGKQMTAG